MENLTNFILEHWIIVVIIDAMILFFIIGYCFEKYIIKKRKNNSLEISDDNHLPEMVSYNENDNGEDIKKINAINNEEILKNIKCDEKINSEEKINKKEKNKQKKDNNVNIIENKKDDDFEKIVPEKKAIDDMKDEFENLELKIDPIKDPKKEDRLDTNIELPEINLTIDDDVIWE